MPNETYEIEVRSPLLRPGITIRTSVSQKYVKTTVLSLLDICREINNAGNISPEIREINYRLLTQSRPL